jgi:hypothetical protein
MNMPMKKGQGLTWDPASVELPEIPTIQPGQDALSATIAAVLPTLGVPLAANVATLQAKEGVFAGKLGAAESAYSNSDDAGSQSVGQVVGMLGQLGQQAGQMGQMGQSVGAPMQALGGQTGMFGSLMQQAMQGTQGGGSSAGQQAGQQSAAPGAAAGGGVPAGAQQPSDEKAADERPGPQETEREEREEREPLLRADDSRPTGGPVPVTPPESAHRGDTLGRRM